MGLKKPEKGTMIMAFFAAVAFFLLFLSVVSTPQRYEHENLHYGSFNTTELAKVHNITYLKVYYSELCTACAKQLPILEELAVKGTLIELIEVNQEPETAIRDSIMVTPTIFAINGPNYLRIDGFADLTQIQEAMEKVRDKSKVMGG